jgi:hypothetical protein
MIRLFSQLVELLGKRHNDHLFVQFLSDIGEKPDWKQWPSDAGDRTIFFNQPHNQICFYKSGFCLCLKYGMLYQVNALINTPSTRGGDRC